MYVTSIIIYRKKAIFVCLGMCVAVASLLSIGLVTNSYAAPPFQETPTPTKKNPEPVAEFEDVTDGAGVAFEGAQFGISWGDYDNDGWIDLFANNHFQDPPNLYRNNGDGTFTDLYPESGGLFTYIHADPHGSSWGDYDNDGDIDLYITTGKSAGINPLFENQGNLKFVERATEAGVEDLDGRGRTANWIDYDNDGDLDLFKGNATGADGPDKFYRNEGGGIFSDVSDEATLNSTSNTMGNVWGDYDNDGDMDVLLTESSHVRLYRNNGDGTFTNVSDQGVGITHADGRSWAADFGDYDNDGDLDIYVARGNYMYFDNIDSSDTSVTYTFVDGGALDDEDGFDFQSTSNDVIFDMLKGPGGLIPVTQVYIGEDKVNPTSIPFTAAEISNPYNQPTYTPGDDVGIFIWFDGTSWHLRVSNMGEVQGQVRTGGTFSDVGEVKLDSPSTYNAAPKYNRLYQNQGDGTFQQVASAAGVDSGQNSTTGTWLDYNNDGLLDLYVVNRGNTVDGYEANHLYRNNGDGTFTDMAAEAKVEALTSEFDDCAAWADYDNDGFLDLFIASQERAGYLSGPHKLYRNLGNTNHWLQIKLVGTVSNRQGIGARVDVAAGGLTQTRQMNNGSHYLCQNSSILHFGLGTITFADTITVTWPSGLTQVVDNQPVDQILTIVEGETIDPTPEADLGITSIPFGKEVIRAGDSLTYTIEITNAGPTTPVTGTVINNFSDKMALAEISSSHDCTWTPGSTAVSCSVEDVTSGDSAYLTLTVTISDTYKGLLTHTATVAPEDILDLYPENNNAIPISVLVIQNEFPNYLPLIVKNLE
ncbi:MAG: FG-GAP-like repeat-containing protein [Chloroflexota bacterium]|nr:FG-GAP-like repeat-containing protein [Chloroflexota bacterium]